MPNTLAHVGVQVAASRGLLPQLDARWLLAGVVIPDAPWILHRLVRAAPVAFDPYALRLYLVAQASLALSLLLAGALAALSRAPRRTFAALALGSLLHLVLDATQTKLGNGVHLLAPFSWELWNLGWYWPESAVSVALTALGAATLAALAPRAWREPLELDLRPARLALAALLAAAWLLAPLGLREGPLAADSHSIATLRARSERPGRLVEFDRERVLREGGRPVLRTWAGERLELAGAPEIPEGVVSLRGRFLGPSRVRVLAHHAHAAPWRDLASAAGLSAIALLTGRGLWLFLRGASGPHTGRG